MPKPRSSQVSLIDTLIDTLIDLLIDTPITIVYHGV